MKKETILLAMISLGMVLVAAGIVMPLFTGIESDVFRYVFAFGAVMLLVGRLFTQYRGKDLRLKRWSRIEVWVALFFCASAFLLFYDRHNLRDPVAFVLAGSVLQIIAAVIIPRLQTKSDSQSRPDDKKE